MLQLLSFPKEHHPLGTHCWNAWVCRGHSHSYHQIAQATVKSHTEVQCFTWNTVFLYIISRSSQFLCSITRLRGASTYTCRVRPRPSLNRLAAQRNYRELLVLGCPSGGRVLGGSTWAPCLPLRKWSMLVHTYNPRTLQVATRGFDIQGHPQLCMDGVWAISD